MTHSEQEVIFHSQVHIEESTLVLRIEAFDSFLSLFDRVVDYFAIFEDLDVRRAEKLFLKLVFA